MCSGFYSWLRAGLQDPAALHVIALFVGLAHREGLAREYAALADGGEQRGLVDGVEQQPEVSGLAASSRTTSAPWM